MNHQSFPTREPVVPPTKFPTHDWSSGTSSSSTVDTTGMTLGIVFGTFGFIIIVWCIVYFTIKRQRQRIFSANSGIITSFKFLNLQPQSNNYNYNQQIPNYQIPLIQNNNINSNLNSNPNNPNINQMEGSISTEGKQSKQEGSTNNINNNNIPIASAPPINSSNLNDSNNNNNNGINPTYIQVQLDVNGPSPSIYSNHSINNISHNNNIQERLNQQLRDDQQRRMQQQQQFQQQQMFQQQQRMQQQQQQQFQQQMNQQRMFQQQQQMNQMNHMNHMRRF